MMGMKKLSEKHQELVDILEKQNQYAFETKAIVAEQLRLLQLITAHLGVSETKKKRASVRLDADSIHSPRRHRSSDENIKTPRETVKTPRRSSSTSWWRRK